MSRMRGFTLVEMVTVIVLISMFAGFFINIFNPAIKQYFALRTQHSLYMQSHLILSQIETDLQDASLQDINIKNPQLCQFTVKKDYKYVFDEGKHKLMRWQQQPAQLITYDLYACHMERVEDLAQLKIKVIMKKDDIIYVREKWFQV